ncbi:UDP-N-acetylmuramoyl-L-alanine--D-glutamate ligase [Schaalia suimastitidis]|uniref:UDP-N-acetylmuramoyl-L-alanine--D-glutamate ligase n=1 Tax=Schaalia suimastitidis TaxID=121163 RepID=UPI00042992B0|nr:UDP-N-acetylmuramoyl-L-alanine--D-glutamate ligase [Schaalia suimastitidis]
MNTRAAVIGWGTSGKAAAAALAARGWEVTAYDSRHGGDPHNAAITVNVIDDPAHLAATVIESQPQLIVVSPGIPSHAPIMAAARDAGIPLWGEVELAWRLQEQGPHAGRPWLCVTGTNGKTTTVGMLGSILRAAGMKAQEVGNIGTPICEAIDTDADIFAVELSSFQLHTTRSVSPLAAICLNVDSDHLDWHGDEMSYAADKARIYEHTRIACVYPAHDRAVEQMVENADVIEGARAIGVTLGAPAISQVGIVENHLVDRAYLPDRHKHALHLADLEDLAPAYGPHPSPAVVFDALAAAALARAADIAPEYIAQGLRNFTPAGHRRAVVSHAADVTWIDDSKATNAHAAAASLSGLRPQSAVWIVGGDAKGQVFDDMIAAVAPTLRGVVLIGADRRLLAQALAANAHGVPVVEVDGHEDWMFSVVNEAVALSRPGDTVVLAPACASWDQFDNYAQRGDAFVEAVKRLESQWRQG